MALKGTVKSMELKDKISALNEYSACDVSDALLKLKCAGAGFLADIVPRSPDAHCLHPKSTIIAPASTVLFMPKDHESSESLSLTGCQPNIPLDSHYVDLTEKGTVVVLSQPQGQKCAVLGGIMATRMSFLGAAAVVVDGRVRDLTELRQTGLPVWSRATSTVGTSAEAKPYALNVAVRVGDVVVKPGDIIFADAVEGVVSIPLEELDQVLELLPKLAAADDRIARDVRKGSTVHDAFARYR